MGRVGAYAKDGKSRFHIGTLATVDERGWPAARSVVLRSAIGMNAGCDSIQTIARKGRTLSAESERSDAFLLSEDRIQLRARVRLEVLAGEALSRSWDRTAAMSRICNRSPRRQGLQSNTRTLWKRIRGHPRGEINFASIRAHIDELEWLYLNSSGHRRARFRFDGEAVQAEWLIP